ncbi:metallophosphoesterase [Oribacterium sp. C9]|uniref:metallophosphoesterase n=1 Tax=Oribacterium sp. C9 TaxID=1943579 RepID=UPI0014399E58|nr:metallophosphoesterase [Oribacterium sp. C9]
MIDVVNTIVVVLNLIMFWIVGDIIEWSIKKIRVKQVYKHTPHLYYTGMIVLLVTSIYLCFGWYLEHHVWRTEYNLTTDKNIGQKELKVILFSDSHIGNSLDGERFEEQMKVIQTEEPDIVLIAGDYVDDDTRKEDMVRSCQALGELRTSYGGYYVSGNHDKGYFNNRDFSYSELTEELEKNEVIVLEDATVKINDSFYVIGRKDRSDRNRKNASEIKEGLDSDKYMIMLDHQPNDYEAEAESGVDLVLSGHTHGGQMFPINILGELTGANDSTYGYEKRKNTEFIVTSGISCWAIKFKTGTRSEYVVLNISEK